MAKKLRQAAKGCVLLVGGHARMEVQYRQIVEARGYSLIYRERKKLAGTPPAIVLAICITGLCSHPLREWAAWLAASQRVPIAYMAEGSQSAVRRALDDFERAAEVPHAR